MIEMPTVFISYETTTGLDFAKHLKESLGKQEISSFVAEQDINIGTTPSKAIRMNLEQSKFFVLILTVTALRSPEVKKEFTLAKELNKDIIPCVKKGLTDLAEADFKEILDVQYLTFETKEELANRVVEMVLRRQLDNYRYSLRRLKMANRENLVDSLLADLVTTEIEIEYILMNPSVDPKEVIFRMKTDDMERAKQQALLRIKKGIAHNG